MAKYDLPHFILSKRARTEKFKTTRLGRNPFIPLRNTQDHGDKLLKDLREAIHSSRLQLRDSGADPNQGLILTLKLFNDSVAFNPEKFENRQGRSHIKLLNVQDVDGRKHITVYVPPDKTNFYPAKIEKYKTVTTARSGKPANADFVNAIASIELGNIKSLWTSSPDKFPKDLNEKVWWEFWLIDDFESVFTQNLAGFDIDLSPERLKFSERVVLLVNASADTLLNYSNHLNSISPHYPIAEIRACESFPGFFILMKPYEQQEWSDDLANRITKSEAAVSTRVCLLDSGIDPNNLIVSKVLATDALHTYHPDWGTYDDLEPGGHGTGMAGLAMLGDLFTLLQGQDAVNCHSELESVKIIPQSNDNKCHLYGYITNQGVFTAEIAAPNKNRIFCLAVTSDYETVYGQPSSWSAEIDRLSYGQFESVSKKEIESKSKRLFIISAGNVNCTSQQDYPSINAAAPIESPAQAWNALTVGAMTYKHSIGDDGFELQPLARFGSLSPYSRTSALWMENVWPLKPDIVFEGGNKAIDSSGFAGDHPDLSLVTTGRVKDSALNSFMATSAATALASKMAADVWSTYNTIWPETVRGLMVHSAAWTDTMVQEFPPINVASKQNLMKRYGYGVPQLEQALKSAENHFSILCEDELVVLDSNYKNYQMNYHRLPWPAQELEELANKKVKLKITLSYFIEPNPSRRGWKSRYGYASHGLRFQLKGALESEQEFIKRINLAAREDGVEESYDTPEPEWLIGSKVRDKGCIISDTWTGTAADLKNQEGVAIYPIGGWWKNNKQNANVPVRYSLIISLDALGEEAQLYSAVQNQITSEIVLDILN